MNPNRFRALVRGLVVVVLLLAPRIASADGAPACPASTVSALLGTTCDIGNLQFSFSSGMILQSSADGIFSTPPWSASDFFLTPVPHGFAISFDGGPLSVAGSFVNNTAVLTYGIGVLGGYGISGVNLTGGAISSSGHGAANYNAGTADSTFTFFTSSQTVTSGGSAATNEQTNAAYPIGVGSGEVFPFELDSGQDGTASWDGAPETLTYTEVFVPEPASLLLLIVGLVCLGGYSLLWNTTNMKIQRN